MKYFTKQGTLKKWLLGLLGCMTLLLVCLQSLLFFFGDEILKKSILVAFSQYHAYRFPDSTVQPDLDFDNLRFNLLAGELTVTRLKLDDLPILEQHELKGKTTLSAEQLTVSGIHLWEIYRSQELNLKKLQLLRPSISVLKEKSSPETQQDADTWIRKNTHRLFAAVTPSWKKVSFDHLQVEDASITVHTTDSLWSGKQVPDALEQFHVQHMHISLTDFLLDSLRLEDTTRILFARQLDLKLGSYRFMFNDSSYYLKADTLSFSTKGQKLQLKNAYLFPQHAKEEPGRLHVHIPELLLTGINLQQIYFDSLLQVEELQIRRPHIKWYTRFSNENPRQPAASILQRLHPDTLKHLLSDELKRLAVHIVQLQNAHLEVLDTSDNSGSLLNIENFSISFKGLLLQHQEVKQDTPLSQSLPLESILLDIQHLKMLTPDKQHRIVSHSVILKTDRQHSYLCDISLRDFHLQPPTDSLTRLLHHTSALELSVPQADLYSVNLQELSQNNMLAMDSAVFSGPELFIDQPAGQVAKDAGTLQKKNTNQANAAGSRQVSHFFGNNLLPAMDSDSAVALLNGILVDYVRIDSGKLQLQQRSQALHYGQKMADIENISASFTKVRFDGTTVHPEKSRGRSTENNLPLQAGEAEVHLQKAAFRLPARESTASATFVRFDEAFLSTTRSEVKLSALHISAATGQSATVQLRECTVPYLSITGLDFERLFNARQAVADYVEVSEPEITVGINHRRRNKDHAETDIQPLYQWIRPHLYAVSLKKLEVDDASLSVEKRNRGGKTFRKYAGSGSLTLSLENFYLDSLSRTSSTTPFYAEQLQLRAKDLYASLSESDEADPVELKAGTLLFSSSSQRLQLQHLKLSSRGKAARQFYTVAVDSISADFENLYAYLKHEELILKNLYILHPEISFNHDISEPQPALFQDRPEMQAGLHTFGQSLFSKLRINTFNVDRGVLKYLTYGQDTVSYLETKSASLTAENIWIENGHQHPAVKMDLTLDMRNCRGSFKQAKQQFKASEVQLSYRKAQLSVKDLNVSAFSGRTEKNADAYTFQLPWLEINNINFTKAFKDGNWEAGEVLIREPAWKGHIPDNSRKEHGNFRQLFGSYTKSLTISQVHLKNGRLQLTQPDAGHGKSIKAQRIDVDMKDFHIDQQVWENHLNINSLTQDVLFAEELEVRGHDYQQTMQDSLLLLRAEAFVFNSRQSAMWISALQLQPLNGRQQPKASDAYRKNWMDCRIPMTRIQSISLQHWWKEGKLRIGTVHFVSPYLHFYTDRQLPANNKKIRPMPQEVLMKLGLPLTIDSMRVTNGFISYEEQAPDTEKSGVLTFEKVNASLKDITNDPDLIRVNTLMSLKADAFLLGKSLLQVDLNFHLGSPDQMFSASGNLEAMDLTLLNVMLEPAASVFISKGMAHHINFQFVGNNERSSGAMRFLYNDLHVLLIDRQTGALGLEERVETFIANTFVLKADNPVGTTLRIGKIAYKRDPARSVFHFVWKSVLSGIKSSIGVEKHGDKTKDLTIMED